MAGYLLEQGEMAVLHCYGPVHLLCQDKECEAFSCGLDDSTGIESGLCLIGLCREAFGCQLSSDGEETKSCKLRAEDKS